MPTCMGSSYQFLLFSTNVEMNVQELEEELLLRKNYVRFPHELTAVVLHAFRTHPPKHTQKNNKQEMWKNELFGSAYLYFTTVTFQYGTFQTLEKQLRLCCFPHWH